MYFVLLGFILRSMSRKNVPEKEQNWQRLGIFWILLEKVYSINQKNLSITQSLNQLVNDVIKNYTLFIG